MTGADNVLAWQTGYPFSVNLSRGYPRYNPGEFSANDLLERGEPDVCLFVGSRGTRYQPEARRPSPHAHDRARSAPGRAEIPPDGAVHHVDLRHPPAGTAYRMDEMPIPLRAVLPTPYPTDADVLQAIQAALGSL